jgi:hypothetical protein
LYPLVGKGKTFRHNGCMPDEAGKVFVFNGLMLSAPVAKVNLVTSAATE